MVLLAAVPLRVAGASQLMPAFALICIYYWDTFCPGMLPYAFLLALGLLEDTLTGLPMGVSSVIFIVFGLLLIRERSNFGRSRFSAVWFGFALLSFVVMALEWIIMSFYSGSMLPIGIHLLQWLATCLAYPPMHLLLTRVYRALMGA